MRAPLHALRVLALAFVLHASVPVAALASWALDGNRVVDPVAQASSRVLVPSDSGDVFMAWIDARSGYNTDVRATLWSARGIPRTGWSASGDLVTAITCAKYELVGTPDGAGGAFLAWSDNRCTGYRNVYLGRARRTGVGASAWPTNGLRCALTTLDQTTPAVVADGEGGAFVAWSDARNGEPDVYLQHVDANAQFVVGWPATGLGVLAATGRQEKPVLASDGAGGVYVAWLDRRTGAPQVRLQRVARDGTLAVGWPVGGVVVASSTSTIIGVTVRADGAGGVLVAWDDFVSGGTRWAVARYTASGLVAPGWPAAGVVLCASAGERTGLRMAPDDQGGAWFAWQDRRNGDWDVVVSRVLGSGALLAGMPANGLVIASATGDQTSPDLSRDGGSGVYLVWSDAGPSGSGASGGGGPTGADVRALRLAADATVSAGWSASGTVLCAAVGDQTAPRVATDPTHGLALWFDTRAGNSGGGSSPALYAQRITPSGPVPVGVASLSASHHDGQTFLTWVSPPDTGWTYRVYVRTSPFTGPADLASASLVGSVGDSTVFDRRLAAFSGVLRTFRTDSLAAPLGHDRGLFVVTPSASRTAWYAVTAQLRGAAEDTRLFAGDNVLQNGVVEGLDLPRPVWQGTLADVAGNPDLYTLWTTHVDTPLFPAMSNRASQPYDCGVLRAAPGAPALVRPHPRGGDFKDQLVHSMSPAEWVLGLDDYTRNEDYSTWWYGHHTGYDFLAATNPVPTSGLVVDYTQRRVLHTVRWWRATFPVDTTRHYAFGYSMGGTMSLRLGLKYPELFAAAMSGVGKVDYSTVDDPEPLSNFNPGRIYRRSLDRVLGPVASNLPTSEGLPVYEATNDGAIATRRAGPGTAFVVNLAGRNDLTVGWYEKKGFYEALETARLGAMQFWDNRDHTAEERPGAMGPMLDVRYLLRFRTDLSWPAFSRCSANDVVGDGTATSGDSLGTINGHMDWDVAVTDSVSHWEVTLRTRAVTTLWGVRPAPESLTVDVTPRRTQRFRPAVGQRVAWRVTRLSDGALLQADTVVVDSLGRVTVPGVRVRSGGTRLVLGAIAGLLGAPGPGVTTNPLLAPFASPARARTELSGAWVQAGAAEVALFDVTGRRARTFVSGPVAAGPWRVTADLGALPPGVYLVRAEQAGLSRTRRLILLR